MSFIDYIGRKMRRLKGTVFLSRVEPEYKEKFETGQLFISLGVSHYTPYTIAAHKVAYDTEKQKFLPVPNWAATIRVLPTNTLLMVVGFMDQNIPVFLTEHGCFSFGHPSSWNHMISPNIQRIETERERLNEIASGKLNGIF